MFPEVLPSNQKHQKCPLLLKRNRVTKRKGETKSKGEKLSKASKVQALAYKHTRDVTRLAERSPM